VIWSWKGPRTEGSTHVTEIDSFAIDILRVAPEPRGASFVPLGESTGDWALLVAGGLVFRFFKHDESGEASSARDRPPSQA
jgi:hypothetical protein